MSESALQKTRSWPALIALSGLVPLIAVAMEWLFFATKPSFLTPLGTGNRLLVLFAGLSLPTLTGLAVGAAMATIASVTKSPLVDRAARVVLIFLIAAVSTVTALLAIDNFTLTVLKFGVRDAGNLRRIVYAVVLATIFALFYRAFWRAGKNDRAARVVAVAIAAVALGGLLAGIVTTRRNKSEATIAGGRRPNVLILGSDGINARRTSLYGAERDTTPFLKQLASESLVAENAFSNAAHTGGSLVSILTGRLPSTTGVIYPPDILRGNDSYRHLPALLKSRGYETLQLSVRHYGDAYDLNILRGFDEVNGRRRAAADIQAAARVVGDDASYLLMTIKERVVERVGHITGRRIMRDVFAEVTSAPAGATGDAATIAKLNDFITHTEAPFFAQVHLMGTHGPKFYPSVRRFSAGQDQTTEWMADFYDDAISDFDRSVARVVETLRKSGKLDNTIVVVYSDHGEGYETTVRVPLLMRFPNMKHRGRIETDVQNIDIAPTILDAMGIEPPSWMEGISLFRLGRTCRPVFSFAADPAEFSLRGGKFITTGNSATGSIGFARVVTCDTAFVVDLHREATTTIPVRRDRDDETNCECGPLDKMRAANLVVEHLRARGMKISELSAKRMAVTAYVTRADLAQAFVRAKHGRHFVPPVPGRSRFEDVPATSPMHPWVEQFVSDGLTGGCGPGRFCPDSTVSRAQLAVFAGSLLGWKPGAIDVPRPVDLNGFEWADYFIRKAVAEHLMRPCGADKFCPGDPVTHDQLKIVMRRMNQ